MNVSLCAAIVCMVSLTGWCAQDTSPKQQPHKPQAEAQTHHESDKPDRGNIEQLRADVRRLKLLLNQMRTNLAFVQTSQTPLKHQFELETDAWQVIVEQMERRLKHMEERSAQADSRR
jgi:CRISPR/Cas system-associated endonuclease/helicase Cas3